MRTHATDMHSQKQALTDAVDMLLHDTRLVHIIFSVHTDRVIEHSRSAPLLTRGAAHEVRSGVGRGELAVARPLFASRPICSDASPPDGGRDRRAPTRETVAGPTDERLGRTTAAGSAPPLPALGSPCPRAGEARCVWHAVEEVVAGVVGRPLGRAGGPTQTPPGVVRGGSRQAPWGGGGTRVANLPRGDPPRSEEAYL